MPASRRPSIPPERVLRAQLLQLFYSIRSERLLMEQLDYNILFRWFVGLEMDEPIWAPTVFTKNRDPLLNQEVARQFPGASSRARRRGCPTSTSRPMARCWRCGRATRVSSPRTARPTVATGAISAARPAPTTRTRPRPTRMRGCTARRFRARRAWRISGTLMENRHGLIVDGMATTADGHAERDAALLLLHRHAPAGRARTVGADKQYDAHDFVNLTQQLGYAPHVSQNVKRRGGSAIDDRTMRHDGYTRSQSCRARIERVFGWLKPLAGLRKVKLRGLEKVDSLFVFACAAFSLRRLPKLMASVPTTA